MSNDMYSLYLELRRKEVEFLNKDKVIDYFYKKCEVNREDYDLFENINYLFKVRGYGVVFEKPKQGSNKKFNHDEYRTLTSKVALSKDKTISLINYLKDVGSRRLTLSSLYLIKIKHLVDANIIKTNNPYLKECYQNDYSILDSLFKNYKSEDEEIKGGIDYIKHHVLAKLTEMGFDKYDYYFWWNEFVLDSEYLLYSIQDYKVSNTIKVIFKIVEREFIDIYKNKQYYTKFDKTENYLSKIDNKLIEEYLEKYKYIVPKLLDDGYVLLYRSLESRRKNK